MCCAWSIFFVLIISLNFTVNYLHSIDKKPKLRQVKQFFQSHTGRLNGHLGLSEYGNLCDAAVTGTNTSFAIRCGSKCKLSLALGMTLNTPARDWQDPYPSHYFFFLGKELDRCFSGVNVPVIHPRLTENRETSSKHPPTPT